MASTMPHSTGPGPRVAARTRATRLPSRAPLGATHREVSLLEGPGRVRAPLGEQVSLSKYRAERHADRPKRRANARHDARTEPRRARHRRRRAHAPPLRRRAVRLTAQRRDVVRRAATTTAFGARFATVTPGKLVTVSATSSDLYTARGALDPPWKACLGSLVLANC